MAEIFGVSTKKTSKKFFKIYSPFYTWNDPEYREFMQALFQTLEPIQYKKGTRFMKELEEFGEINFVSDGEIHVGFEINKLEIYTMR
jgi:hypothetical protein